MADRRCACGSELPAQATAIKTVCRTLDAMRRISDKGEAWDRFESSVRGLLGEMSGACSRCTITQAQRLKESPIQLLK